MAEELWNEVRGQMNRFFPHATGAFAKDFDVLGESSKSPADLAAAVVRLVHELQKS
jgi:hypothetical protein